MNAANCRRTRRGRGGAALVVAFGAILATAGPALAAFQVVRMSATSGDPGDNVTIRVEASLLIGGSEQSQLFLIPKNAYDSRSEPEKCDALPGAEVVGELTWDAGPVQFQGQTYAGFIGAGSFPVPAVPTGIYVVAGALDDPYTGCHVFAAFGVGMDLPDTATATPGWGRLVSFTGIAILIAGVLRVPRVRRKVADVIVITRTRTEG